MGLTDAVVATCPHCGSIVSWHTSAGPCLLKEWDADAVPESVGRSMTGDKASCPKCRKLWALLPRENQTVKDEIAFEVVETKRNDS